VSITLSSADLAQLESAITTLVSPLHYERIGDWRTECRVVVERVIGADRSAGMLPCADEPLGESHPDLLPAITDYVNYYHTLDVGLQVKRRELGLEVCHWSTVYDMRQLMETEIYNDFSLPHGMLDCTGMVYDFDPSLPPAALLYYHEREETRPFGERGLTLLRLLMPAFKAGIQSFLKLATQRARLTRFFDTLDNAFACFEARGQLVQRNSAMTKLLSAEPERERLEMQMRAAAIAASAFDQRTARHVRSDAAAIPPWRELRTSSQRYHMSTSLLPAGLLALQPLAVVAIERVGAQPLGAAELRVRYGLTPREIDVARLLASRHTTSETAAALGISVHTARRHSESVLSKLGVHSRREVARLLVT
jgi:DNA-binding CsgD family transcriptional regulator